MTKERMRIEIAKALGIPLTETLWKFDYMGVSSAGWPTREGAELELSRLEAKGFVCSNLRSYERVKELPDFPECLNACHEMENSLSVGESLGYDQELTALCGTLDYHATAEQKCIAFLKAKGLWEEDETAQ